MNPAHRFPGITWPIARAEVDRELAYRRKTHPDRIASGRMTATESEYSQSILVAIAADVDRMAHIGPDPVPPATHSFSWNDRRHALSREIDMRDRFYPEWIAGGRLTQVRADHQLAAIRAILWRYDNGFDWRPSNGVFDLSAQDVLDGKRRTPEQAETWAEMDAIWRRPHGLFYRRWPDPQAAPAEPELVL